MDGVISLGKEFLLAMQQVLSYFVVPDQRVYWLIRSNIDGRFYGNSIKSITQPR